MRASCILALAEAAGARDNLAAQGARDHRSLRGAARPREAHDEHPVGACSIPQPSTLNPRPQHVHLSTLTRPQHAVGAHPPSQTCVPAEVKTLRTVRPLR
eukprot:2852273-Prymnesium_polylepis.1